MNDPEYFLIHNTENFISINGRDMPYELRSEYEASKRLKQLRLTDSEKEAIISEFKLACENLVNDAWYIFTRDAKTHERIVQKLYNYTFEEDESYLLFFNDSNHGTVYIEDNIIFVKRGGVHKGTYTFKSKVEVPRFLLKVDTDAELLVIPKKLVEKAFSLDDYQDVLVECSYKPVKFSLINFKTYLENKDLWYSDIDLRKIEAAVKSNYLTIIKGCPGIGKSELVKSYIEFMTKNNKSRYVMVSITKLFADPSFFVGYYSNSKNIYQPDKNGVINIIMEANKEENKCKIFYVFLDEMNIVPVENWFGEFLSKMESHDDLTLYDDKAERRTELDDLIEGYKDIIPPVIVKKLKDISKPLTYECSYSLENIKFIGTINMDESGTILSERVLDRADIIELERPSIDQVIKASKEFHDLSKCQQIFIDIAKEIEIKIEEVKNELYAQSKDYSYMERVNISPRALKISLRNIKSAESIDGSQGKVDEIIDSVLYGKVFSKFLMNSNETLIEKLLEVCNSSSYNLKTSVEYLRRMQNTLEAGY